MTSSGAGKSQGKGKQVDPIGKGYASMESRTSLTNPSAGTRRSTVRAAPGPGEGVTRAYLTSDLWSTMGKSWVLTFYGHHSSQPYGCFSNFFSAPLVFVMPEEFCAFELSLEERTVECDFAEKAIMLCKAAAMGDCNSYHRIRMSKDPPAAIKNMGRQVQGFSEEIWREIECSVAFEVVYQKFLNVEELQAKLLATEDWILAEATANDRNWATGLDQRDQRNHNPPQWQGSNMLGWALMEARKALRSGSLAAGAPRPAADHVARPETTHVPEDSMEPSQEERRIDPALNDNVTYLEMCEGHRDQGLSEDELKAHWTKLKVDMNGGSELQQEERHCRWHKKRTR